MREEPLAISHRQLIKNHLSEIKSNFSELTFGNLYLWRHVAQYMLVEAEGVLGVKGISRDRKPILIPLSSNMQSYRVLLEKNRELHLFPIPEAALNFFPEEQFSKETDQGWDDYIYQTIKVSDYSGRALDGKRNHVKHFTQEYPYEIFAYEERFKEGAKHLLKSWKEKHSHVGDYYVCLAALEEFEELELTGIVLQSNGETIGLALGEPISDGMFDIQFAKANPSYKGIYSFLFQSFAKQLENYQWLNFECDLGIEGLRKSKHEYAPNHLEKKWRVKAR